MRAGEFGGAAFGFEGLGVVLEEAGRALVASPLLSSVVLGGSAIALGGSAAQKADVLPAIASGERLLALALEETAHHAPYRIATRATASGEGFSLSGQKTFVLDGHVADQLIVVARTSGEVSARDGLTLFLVDAGARGVKTTRTTMVDSRNAANITLDGVDVGTDAIIGELDRGAEVLDAVLDRGRIALAAEMAKKSGKDPSSVRVALAFENDPFSLDVRAGVIDDMKKYGMKAVIDDKLPRDLSDMSATLPKVKRSEEHTSELQ